MAENVKGKGRHYRDPRTDTLVPSVTTVLGALSKPALPGWAARVVAEQAAAMKSSLGNLEDAEIVDLLKGAPWRSSGRAAARGTSVHSVIEQKLAGHDIEPDETGVVAPWVESVDKFLSENTVEMWHTELTMFGDGYAGTCDFVGKVNGVPCYADWKTGKDLYPEVALQLSALAACNYWALPDDTLFVPNGEQPPRTMLAVLFTEKGYKVKAVADCYDTFQSLRDVWMWQNGEKGERLVDWAD